jgi:isopentenyl-diphosphate delta-isomerase
MQERVVLVDKEDKEIGTEEKLNAHLEKKLHRAISILIFNINGEMLLQQRSSVKYHCPLMWSNACCTHPRQGESVIEAAHRRLKEEMGFDCDLVEVESFIYEANLGNGLFEYEYDHLFIGNYDGELNINSDEVELFKWVQLDDLIQEVENYPEKFTEWFKIILKNYTSKQMDLS